MSSNVVKKDTYNDAQLSSLHKMHSTKINVENARSKQSSIVKSSKALYICPDVWIPVTSLSHANSPDNSSSVLIGASKLYKSVDRS